jgi:hypothetical protein
MYAYGNAGVAARGKTEVRRRDRLHRRPQEERVRRKTLYHAIPPEKSSGRGATAQGTVAVYRRHRPATPPRKSRKGTATITQISLMKEEASREREVRNMFVECGGLRLDQTTKNFFREAEQLDQKGLVVRLGAFSPLISDKEYPSPHADSYSRPTPPASKASPSLPTKSKVPTSAGRFSTTSSDCESSRTTGFRAWRQGRVGRGGGSRWWCGGRTSSANWCSERGQWRRPATR